MRKEWIDVAKGIAIILVCIGHTRLVKNDYIASWIYSFHMPFFFVVAGYCLNLTRYSSYVQYLIRKLKVLAYPCLMLSIAGAFIRMCLIPENWNLQLALKQLCNSVYPYPGCYMVGFWFIHVLLIVEIVFAIFRKWTIHIAFAVCIIASLYPFSESIAFQIPAFFRAFVFYYIGCMLRIFSLERRLQAASLLVKSAALAVIGVAHLCVLWANDFPIYHCGDLPLKGPLVYFTVSMLGSLGLIFVANLVEHICVVGKALSWLGRYSILLLAVHPICGVARASWCNHFNWMSGAVSLIFELLFICLFMWALSGPMNFFMRIPKFGREGK